jgi:hypothetical protein
MNNVGIVEEWLDLEVNPSTLRVRNHESTHREFKRSFEVGNTAKIAKTIAAFANRDGGVIFIGVKDRPREIVGVNADTFPDEQQLSGFLQAHFHPEIQITSQIEEIYGKTVYKLIVRSSPKKPVICSKVKKLKKGHGVAEVEVLREGAIYYRYRASSSEIKYTDLQNLLDRERESFFKSMIEGLSLYNQVGHTKAAIVDATQMKESGEKAQVYLTNDTAKNLNWINSGRFSESQDEGAKAYYVVREVELAQGIEVPVPVDPSQTHPHTKTAMSRAVKLNGDRFQSVIWKLGILDHPNYHVTGKHGKSTMHKFTDSALNRVLEHFPIEMDSRKEKVDAVLADYKSAVKAGG